MSELTDMEARLTAVLNTVRSDIIQWRWYLIVALASLASLSAGLAAGRYL